MMIWGGIWLGALAILALVIGFDDLSDVFLYALFGAVAGAHIQSELKKLFSSWLIEAQKEQLESEQKLQNHYAQYVKNVPNTLLEEVEPVVQQKSEPFTPVLTKIEPEPRYDDFVSTQTFEPFQPSEPTPNAIERLFASGKNWLFGGNTVVRVGVLVLFVGLVFLAKYTAQMLTVVKLILIDLVNRGGFERIVAFIAVGAMILVIGYLAPLPPAKESV